MTNVVFITGSEGGIGQAMVEHFKEKGYRTIGADLFKSKEPEVDELRMDLNNLTSEAEIIWLRERLTAMLGEDLLAGVINNAATQILAPFEELTLESFSISMQVNCTAAFAVSKAAFPALAASKGTIVNIGSIHARLTKPNFIAYATSKSAIEGLTRAMAVELGALVKICAISPAAIATDMLRAGFKGKEESLRDLESYHPTQKIGRAEEIARVAALLIERELPFTNGAIFGIDGGIGSVLHDPG